MNGSSVVRCSQCLTRLGEARLDDEAGNGFCSFECVDFFSRGIQYVPLVRTAPSTATNHTGEAKT